jgi:hypothetical protein
MQLSRWAVVFINLASTATVMDEITFTARPIKAAGLNDGRKFAPGSQGADAADKFDSAKNFGGDDSP